MAADSVRLRSQPAPAGPTASARALARLLRLRQHQRRQPARAAPLLGTKPGTRAASARRRRPRSSRGPCPKLRTTAAPLASPPGAIRLGAPAARSTRNVEGRWL
eukprot:13832146-Alexandrium_andersonii.AAC.1